jgi:hypothetical protein
MADYWPEAKRKLQHGRYVLGHGRAVQAEQLFFEARAAVADNEGLECARWGVATLDLAKCALQQANHVLAKRRGLNALRVLMAEGSSGARLLAADAAAAVGDALCELDACGEAIRYLEFAVATVGSAADAVYVTSHADVRLAFAYSNLGGSEDAGDAIVRAWSSVGDEGSWLRGQEAWIARWMIGHLQRAGRFAEAKPAWEWLAAHGLAEDDWYTLHRFVGAMAVAGSVDEAQSLFHRIEELEDARAGADE